MASKTEIISFYDFWAWQYKKRNPEIVTAANTVKNNADLLYATGLLREKAAIFRTQNLQGFDQARYQPFSFEYLRDPTDNEQQILAELTQHFQLLADLDYNIYAVFEVTPTSTDIIRAISAPPTVYGMTPVSQFREETSAALGLGKVSGGSQESTMLPHNERFLDYYCFYIDIAAADAAITASVLREVQRMRCLERGGSYDSENCPASCPSLGRCAPRHNELLEAEIHAVYRDGRGANFKTDSFAPRAIGLWLWEYCQTHRKNEGKSTVSAAISAFDIEILPLVASTGKDYSDVRKLRKYHTKTAMCIKAAKVLPLN